MQLSYKTIKYTQFLTYTSNPVYREAETYRWFFFVQAIFNVSHAPLRQVWRPFEKIT